MKLLTKKLEEKLPSIEEAKKSDDPIVYVKNTSTLWLIGPGLLQATLTVTFGDWWMEIF